MSHSATKTSSRKSRSHRPKGRTNHRKTQRTTRAQRRHFSHLCTRPTRKPAAQRGPRRRPALGHKTHTPLLHEHPNPLHHQAKQTTATLNALQQHKDDISPTFALALRDSPQLTEDHDAVQRWATKLAPFAFFALFFVRRRLQAFSQQRALPNNRSLQAPLQHAQQARTLQEELADANEEMQALFGIHWQGEDTDSITLQKTWEWARSEERR